MLALVTLICWGGVALVWGALVLAERHASELAAAWADVADTWQARWYALARRGPWALDESSHHARGTRGPTPRVTPAADGGQP